MEVENTTPKSPVKLKSKSGGGRYTMSIRKGVYKCLESQVPVESVGGVIEFTVMAVTGKYLDSTPSSSTAAHLTREMGVISNIQVAEALLSSSSVNLAWDATTIKDKHVNQNHINTPTQSHTLNTEHLAGGRATDYANHITDALEKLAFLQSKFSGQEYEATLFEMPGKILSTFTDRAAAKHATVEILQEKLNINLLELNCQVYPLDGLANAARTMLKAEERKEGITSRAFGSDYCAANLLHLISKLRYKGKGDPAGFEASLKSKELKCGLFVLYMGNRLHDM